MASSGKLSRRHFLATGASTLAIPMILPRSVFGANEAIVTGHIGVGNQGTPNLRAFMKQGTKPAAVCEVDRNRLAEAVKLAEGGKGQGKTEAFTDYRKLLDRKDIDAVVITTPDHWHALCTIHACEAGKDVYCEKPLTLTIAEGRKMVDVARKTKRIVQTGSQQRSEYGGKFRIASELVRSGKIGKIQTVLVGIPAVNFKGEAVPDSDPPPELDYDLWLGPAPKKPYNEKHVHYNFRFFWDYSGGQMTNFGAHDVDITQWALGMDNSGPTSAEVVGIGFDPEKRFEVPVIGRINYLYDNGVKLIVGQNQKDIPGGCTFIGTEGTIHVDRKKMTSTPEEIVKNGISAGDVHLYESPNHHQNFLDCMKSRKLPICDVEIGHRSATVCHIGNIAIRLGRKVRWDPSAEKFVGDDQAEAMASRPYRSPWSI
jgi:predicted dehydrogenase